MLETMERNAERMQHLIGEILDLARYRAGTIGLQLRPFDAAELAESAVATIRPLAEGRNQTVELQGPARSRSTRVRRSPAARSSAPEPRQLMPSTSRRTAGAITVRLHRPAKGMIRWSVTDDGPGIALEDQAHLFERFYVGTHDPTKRTKALDSDCQERSRSRKLTAGRSMFAAGRAMGSTFTLVVPVAGPPEEAG